jgi:hypothetical protein
VKADTYRAHLKAAATREFKKFWSGYRLLVTMSGLLAPALFQLHRGTHTLLSVAEAMGVAQSAFSCPYWGHICIPGERARKPWMRSTSSEFLSWKGPLSNCALSSRPPSAIRAQSDSTKKQSCMLGNSEMMAGRCSNVCCGMTLLHSALSILRYSCRYRPNNFKRYSRKR